MFHGHNLDFQPWFLSMSGSISFLRLHFFIASAPPHLASLSKGIFLFGGIILEKLQISYGELIDWLCEFPLEIYFVVNFIFWYWAFFVWAWFFREARCDSSLEAFFLLKGPLCIFFGCINSCPGWLEIFLLHLEAFWLVISLFSREWTIFFEGTYSFP